MCLPRGDRGLFPVGPGEPGRRFRVARHAPVAARRQADRADLGAVGQTGAFELVREETPQEHLEPAAHLIGRVGLLEFRVLRQEQDLLRRRSIAQEMKQEEQLQIMLTKGRIQ